MWLGKNDFKIIQPTNMRSKFELESFKTWKSADIIIKLFVLIKILKLQINIIMCMVSLDLENTLWSFYNV